MDSNYVHLLKGFTTMFMYFSKYLLIVTSSFYSTNNDFQLKHDDLTNYLLQMKQHNSLNKADKAPR